MFVLLQVVAALNPIAGEKMQNDLEERIVALQAELERAHHEVSLKAQPSLSTESTCLPASAWMTLHFRLTCTCMQQVHYSEERLENTIEELTRLEMAAHGFSAALSYPVDPPTQSLAGSTTGPQPDRKSQISASTSAPSDDAVRAATAVREAEVASSSGGGVAEQQQLRSVQVMQQPSASGSPRQQQQQQHRPLAPQQQPSETQWNRCVAA